MSLVPVAIAYSMLYSLATPYVNYCCADPSTFSQDVQRLGGEVQFTLGCTHHSWRYDVSKIGGAQCNINKSAQVHYIRSYSRHVVVHFCLCFLVAYWILWDPFVTSWFGQHFVLFVS